MSAEEGVDGDRYFTLPEADSLRGRRYRATASYAQVPAGSVGVVSGVYPAGGGRYGVDVTWIGVACSSPLGVERGGLTDGFSRRDLLLVFTEGPNRGRRAMVPVDGDERPVRLSDGRRRALEVLAAAEGHAARESNDTDAGGAGVARIYWQSRAWLSANELLETVPGRPGWYRLTAAGVELAGRLASAAPR